MQLKKLIVKSNISLKQALKAMNTGGEKCLIVVDKKNFFLGTLSDGDLRKAILKNKSLEDNINSVYNKNSTFFKKKQLFKRTSLQNFFKGKI